MNMKKTVAAVAMSTLAISALAVPVNAVVTDANKTGGTFTYSLVKEYKEATWGTANIAATFIANPATDLIVIQLNGVAYNCPVTITATAIDGDVRFTPFTFTPEGDNRDTYLAKGYDYNSTTHTLTINPGAYSQAWTQANFTVSGLLNDTSDHKGVSAHDNKYLNGTTAIPGLYEEAATNNYLGVKVATPGQGTYVTDAAGEAAARAQGEAAYIASLSLGLDVTATMAVKQMFLDSAEGAELDGKITAAEDLVTAAKNTATGKVALANDKYKAEVEADATSIATAAAAGYAAADAVDGVSNENNISGTETGAAAYGSGELAAADDDIAAAAGVSDDTAVAAQGTNAAQEQYAYNNAYTLKMAELVKAAQTADAKGYITAAKDAITKLETAVTNAKTAYTTAETAYITAYQKELYAPYADAITAAGDAAVAEFRLIPNTNAGDPVLANAVEPASYRRNITAFTAPGDNVVKVPYKSFVNGSDTGPKDIITWLGGKPAAESKSGYKWNGDGNKNGSLDASERAWETGVLKKLDGTVPKAENAYMNVQAVLNDTVNSYPNVTFTFNTAVDKVLDEAALIDGEWRAAKYLDSYNSSGSDKYMKGFTQNLYNQYGSSAPSPSAQYVPFDPGIYFTNGIAYTLFSGALIINDSYTMQLSDTDLFEFGATTLTFDYQALLDQRYVESYNPALKLMYSMKLATSIPWYWDSMTVAFAAAEDDTAASAAGAEADDEVLPDEPVEDELPAEEVETLPAETEAPAPETEAPAPVAPNPSTGNAPVALAVIPVALAAAAIIAKKRK
ncbi:MAG: hypothetical protein LBM59_00470 [Ruminococcus sp.]|jgi:hypothetical protein|nr:hypothetical protein [Ruminococcus sp.]